MFALPRLIYNNKFSLPSLPPPGTFKNQTILITGASSGIGLATAVHFINLGASSVIITARTLTKGLAAKQSIIAQTNCDGNVISVMDLDMSTFGGVVSFVNHVKKEVKNVNYVLLNAGTLNNKFVAGKEGYEESIQVNALSTGLLGLLLLPWLKEIGKGKAHMAFVGSGRHRSVCIREDKWPQANIFDFFSKEENWPGDIYPTSKILEQYIVNEVAKLAIGPDGNPRVIINSLCPGMVKSDLGRDYKTNFLMSFAVNAFMTIFAKTTEGGARTPVLVACTTPEEHGKYVTFYQSDDDYKQEVQHNVLGAEGQEMQARVWKEAIQIMSKRVPEVLTIVNFHET